MKAFITFLLITFAVSFSLWPDFHPEEIILNQSYNWLIDTIFHSCTYLGITLFTRILLFKYTKRNIHLFFILFGVSFLLEIIQMYIPGRSFTYLDLFSNALGITIGLVVSNFILLALKTKQIQ